MARPKNINKETIDQIRQLHKEGNHTQIQLAEQFGLSQSTICKIVNNYIHRPANICVGGRAQVKQGMQKSFKYGD
jgi:DNA-binding XRE family transcriptional regulator